MMRLKVTTRLTYYVTDDDLENFIDEVYGTRGYSIEFGEYLNPHFSKAIDVSTIEPLAVWDREVVEEFKRSGFCYQALRPIMQDMVNRGIIPTGYYVVTVV